jgi:Holliday junction resolvase
VVNNYRRGRIAEKKVVNRLKARGFKNVRRSAGSRGPADIYARKGSQKYYIQVKSGSARMSKGEVSKLRSLAKKRGGTAVGIRKNGSKMSWRFMGRWK